MNPLLARRIRLGVIAFILTGAVTVVGLLLRGPNRPASADSAAWAEAAASGTSHLGWLVLLPGPVLQLFAFLAIAASLRGTASERLAFRGAMWSLAGNGLYLPFVGLSAFLDKPAADAYLAGESGAVEIVRSAMFEGAGLSILLLSAIILVAGVAMTSVAVWRTAVLPRGTAVIYLLQVLCLTIAAQFAYAVELTGGVLLLASSVWMGAAMWRRAEQAAAEPTLAAAAA